MIQKKLILSDIDGTFLGKRSRRVEKNLIAIERFKKNGGLFAFSSGRSEVTMRRIIPDAASIVNAPAILTNGSYVYDFAAKEKLFYTPINADKAIPIFEALLEACEGTALRVNRHDHFISNRMSEPFARDIRDADPSFRAVYPFAEMPRDGWSKAVFYGTAETLAPARRFLDGHNEGDFSVTFSGPRMLEIADRNATKGKRIADLRTYYREKGIDVRIYAIGDYENDLDMLKAADVAVCPANAIESVKAVCRAVMCDHDEGAVADLIEHIEHKAL